jgi:tetratricopeptide (TPR) repeat protein
MKIFIRFICLLLIFTFLNLCKNTLQKTSSAGKREDVKKYIRVEGESVKAFYKAYAEFAQETPQKISRLVEEIKKQTGLPRVSQAYPTDQKTIRETSNAFINAVHKIFGFELSMESTDSSQLDRLANTFLIDPEIRKFFHGKNLKDNLSKEESEIYYKLCDQIKIPNEPLLYYSMGCYWGEWLCHHRQFKWMLLEPLNPLQSFPDMITALYTVCMMPYSQVVKKLSDPERDSLHFKASLSSTMLRSFKPYLLIASMSDADHAAGSLLSDEAREALDKSREGKLKEAFKLYSRAIKADPENPKLYSMAIQTAWQLKKWDHVVLWSETALELTPENPVLNHNLAVLYSNSQKDLPKAVILLKRVLKSDPNYGRAHLTLASCYLELGNKKEASKHAEWVLTHDSKLKKEAREFLNSMKEK